MSDWIDPDDAPELTEELAAVAEIRVGGKVIREATGYLGPNGVVRGRPPLRDRAVSRWGGGVAGAHERGAAEGCGVVAISPLQAKKHGSPVIPSK